MSEVLRIEDSVSLRCKYCGAPLDVVEPISEYIKCNSCGTTQKLIDARAFLEQIMGQVYNWVKTALPSGFDISGAENVDPVARHNIFVSNIKPTLESEYSHYKFNSQRLLAQSLLILPFTVNEEIHSTFTSTKLFEFNARINSIKPLVIDQNDTGYIGEMDNVSESYAYLLNNVRLMQERRSERYELMAANFFSASGSVKNNEHLKFLYHRFVGLCQVNLAIHLLINGNCTDAMKTINLGISSLNFAQKYGTENPVDAIMIPAIDREVLIANINRKVISASQADPSGDPLNTVMIIEKIITELKNQEQYDSGYWRGSFKDYHRYYEIFSMVDKIRKAQNGDGNMRILNGAGSHLFPFWVVDLPYSFKTGIMWMKSGKETKETLFVSSNFPTNSESLSSYPSMVLTHVFKKDQSKGVFESTLSNILGNEESISSGGNKLRKIAYSSSLQPVGNQIIIPPLSSKKQVEKMVNLYLNQMLKTNKSIEQKFGLSAPKVIGLIFLPGELSNSGFKLHLDLGQMTPQSIGDVKKLHSIAM